MLLPVSALFLNRPMPPARKLVDAGAAVALATDFNPGSAFCESLPSSARSRTQLGLPAEALTACTVNAAHVLARRSQRTSRARLRRRHRPLEAPDWRYLAYHLVGDVVAGVIEDSDEAALG